ncbi:peptidase inhibitor family I36 protein [Streptomyces sp. NPDC048643]|uniref:peptidase inhibitor family I36 protein n=1 Tax=Streptomyces sp. NPDC048643 TaxID=3155637 RepID=UPI003415B4CB
MRHKIAMAIGASFLAVAGTVGFSSTALAQPHPSAIAASYFVLYEDDNYSGRHANFSGSDVELNNKYWSGSTSAFAQNGGSSMENNTSSNVGLWDKGTTCTGTSYTAKANSKDSDFSNNNFDNKASCVRFL